MVIEFWISTLGLTVWFYEKLNDKRYDISFGIGNNLTRTQVFDIFCKTLVKRVINNISFLHDVYDDMILTSLFIYSEYLWLSVQRSLINIVDCVFWGFFLTFFFTIHLTLSRLYMHNSITGILFSVVDNLRAALSKLECRVAVLEKCPASVTPAPAASVPYTNVSGCWPFGDLSSKSASSHLISPGHCCPSEDQCPSYTGGRIRRWWRRYRPVR